MSLSVSVLFRGRQSWQFAIQAEVYNIYRTYLHTYIYLFLVCRTRKRKEKKINCAMKINATCFLLPFCNSLCPSCHRPRFSSLCCFLSVMKSKECCIGEKYINWNYFDTISILKHECPKMSQMIIICF